MLIAAAPMRSQYYISVSIGLGFGISCPARRLLASNSHGRPQHILLNMMRFSLQLPEAFSDAAFIFVH